MLLRAGFRILPEEEVPNGPAGSHEPDLGRFLVRPSAEPIIYSSWNRFTEWRIDEAWALATVGLLDGGGRGRRGATAGNPAYLGLPAMTFAPLDAAGHWVEALDAIRRCPALSPLQEAALMHATLILYHPLDDGNGRLARVLFHASLGSRAAIDAPFLALGPVTYRMSFYNLGLTRHLSDSGDWPAYLDGFYQTIAAALTAQERIDDENLDITGTYGPA